MTSGTSVGYGVRVYAIWYVTRFPILGGASYDYRRSEPDGQPDGERRIHTLQKKFKRFSVGICKLLTIGML